jgi:hypothetical protein
MYLPKFGGFSGQDLILIGEETEGIILLVFLIAIE